MIVVVLGPPGAGKGTQAARLAAQGDWRHVSTGDIFRDNLSRDTPLGRRARGYLGRGELVPDQVVIAMMADVLAAGSDFVLDGYPRTVAQAEALDASAREVVALKLVVERQELLARLTGRRLCRQAGHVYHVRFHPPTREGVCDVDGSPLVQREDDSPDTVATRLEVYARETQPVVDYYQASGRLVALDGSGDPDEVARRLRQALTVAQSSAKL